MSTIDSPENNPDLPRFDWNQKDPARNSMYQSLGLPSGRPLALIAGPTASGKSECAVRLAEALATAGRRAAIVNADSAQVYADLAVLSGRPTVQDMRGIDHFLYGAWDGATICSAADWAARARDVIASLHEQGIVPILVGGTGFYIRTLLDGIAPVPPIDEDIRQQVRAMPVAEAYAALLHEDPERAAALHPADSTRIARALEVVRSTGTPLAVWQTRTEGGIGDKVALHPLVLLPDRAWLYARCMARFAAMLHNGAVAEVEALLARGLDPRLPVMRAIGVYEISLYLQGTYTLEDVQWEGEYRTRAYAKRQFTWLRHQPPPEWPRVPPENCSVREIFVTLFQE